MKKKTASYIPEAVLEERATEYAQITDTHLGGDDHIGKSVKEDWLVFRLADQKFAVPMKSLDEIAPTGNGTILPGFPKEIIGLMNLRAENLLLIDFARVLGIDQGDNAGMTDRQQVLILKDEEQRRTGFLIDSIEHAQQFEKGFFEVITATGRADHKSPIDGVGDMQGQSINRINVSSLLEMVKNIL